MWELTLKLIVVDCFGLTINFVIKLILDLKVKQSRYRPAGPRGF